MTAEELYRLPDVNKLERRLIDGRLVERPYEYRSPGHASAVAKLGAILHNWAKSRTPRDWIAYGYDCPYRLRRDPDTFVCFDASVNPARVERESPDRAAFFDATPVLAAEVVDLGDTSEETVELRDATLSAAVPVFWIVNPVLELVDEFRPGHEPRTHIRGDIIDLEPLLPGLRVPVHELFDE